MAKRLKLNSRISIRCTEKEKDEFDRLVEERNSSQRECFMNCVEDSKRKEERDYREKQNLLKCACKLQNIVNHLRNYAEDELVIKECDEIWKIL